MSTTDPQRPTTDATPAAWIVRASSAAVDLDGLLDRFGRIHRLPIAAGERAAALAPGTPCFLVRTDRHRVAGLWAVGEVVAPTLSLPAGTPLLPAEEPLGDAIDPLAARTYAEVELLPIAKPVALEALLADARLARSELGDRGTDLAADEPLRLRGGELRAIEEIELWIDDPDDEQRGALDRLLAEEDPILDRLGLGA